MGSYDPVAYAAAIDAFTHPGPAVPARVPRSVCATPFQPEVDPLTSRPTTPRTPAEP